MKKVALILAVICMVGFACSSPKKTVSKEKQEQIDKDKKDFEKNVE
jgi:hypothetical protein